MQTLGPSPFRKRSSFQNPLYGSGMTMRTNFGLNFGSLVPTQKRGFLQVQQIVRCLNLADKKFE